MKKLLIGLSLAVSLACKPAYANFAWGEHPICGCGACGENIQYAPMGNPPQMVPVAWDVCLTYNGEPGGLSCPH